MSMGVNKAILIGNLGRDPDDGVMPSGDALSNISVGIGYKSKNRNGELEDKTEWINVVAFGKLADIFNKYLVKGSKVYIEGVFKTEKFHGKNDGENDPWRYKTKIIASVMRMLDSKGDNKNAAQSEQSIEAAAKKHRNVKSGMDSMESLHGDNVKDDADIQF